MVSRRGLLSGIGLVGAGGVGGWAYATGNLPSELLALLPAGAMSVGEATQFGEFTIGVTDVATAEEATYTEGDQTRSWQAPEGAKLALFKLKVTNNDITKHSAPALNLRQYDVMKEEPNTIYLGGVNDIRVYGDNEGAVLPEFKYQSYGVDAITVHDRRLATYPVSASGTGPTVRPNQTLAGWVWGLIEVEKTPGLKLQTEKHSARWRYDDTSSSIVPSQNKTISF